jgi:hypothetical protein
MSNEHANPNDPLGFVRNMWGNMGFSLPGMVTPTFDVDELEKRIKDLKAVEGWLRMNLSMLQATIQGLEMQVTTLAAVKAMGTMASNAAQQAAQGASQAAGSAGTQPPAADAAMGTSPEAAGALSQAAMWPWHLMQQMQEQLQEQAEAAKAKAKAPEPKPAASKKAAAPKRPRKPAA